jgi:hypothetical protein
MVEPARSAGEHSGIGGLLHGIALHFGEIAKEAWYESRLNIQNTLSLDLMLSLRHFSKKFVDGRDRVYGSLCGVGPPAPISRRPGSEVGAVVRQSAGFARRGGARSPVLHVHQDDTFQP